MVEFPVVVGKHTTYPGGCEEGAARQTLNQIVLSVAHIFMVMFTLEGSVTIALPP
jgi:hypothetical protein